MHVFLIVSNVFYVHIWNRNKSLSCPIDMIPCTNGKAIHMLTLYMMALTNKHCNTKTVGLALSSIQEGHTGGVSGTVHEPNK